MNGFTNLTTEVTGRLKSIDTQRRRIVYCVSAIYFQGSVEVVLQAFPQVGQLLGRLGTLPLTSESCYKALMRCFLFFCASQPRSAVEARAKQWALVSYGRLFRSEAYHIVVSV